MVEFIEDKSVYPTLVELSACLCREIAAAGLPEPCFCGVLPGSVAALAYCDACQGGDGDCVGGQAWVRLVSVQPQLGAAIPGASTPCAPPLNFTIEVGVVRCISMFSNETGEPASVSQMLDATRLQLADMRAMQRAITCCLKVGDGRVTLSQYQPVGPEGGCVGGVWNVVLEP